MPKRLQGNAAEVFEQVAKNTVKRIPAAPSITRWSNDRLQRHIRHGLQAKPFRTDSICNLPTPERLLLGFIMRIKLIPLKLEMMKQASYSELNLNQYSVGSPCRTICTICGSPPCPDLNLIHYRTDCITEYPASRIFPLCPSDGTAKPPRRGRGHLKLHLRAVIQFFFGLQFKKHKPKG